MYSLPNTKEAVYRSLLCAAGSIVGWNVVIGHGYPEIVPVTLLYLAVLGPIVFCFLMIVIYPMEEVLAAWQARRAMIVGAPVVCYIAPAPMMKMFTRTHQVAGLDMIEPIALACGFLWAVTSFVPPLRPKS